MTTHELKTTRDHFANIWSGIKTFELRKNDRGFQVGDALVLREWDPFFAEKDLCGYGSSFFACGPQNPMAGYTGRKVTVRVHLVVGGKDGERLGLQPGYVILGIQETERKGDHHERTDQASAHQPAGGS